MLQHATIAYIQNFIYPLRSLVDSITNLKSVQGVVNDIILLIEKDREKNNLLIETKQKSIGCIKLNNISCNFDTFKIQNFNYTFEKGKNMQ